MITQKEIRLYFDEEAEASKLSHDKLMSEDISERIRKRKAISGLHLVKGQDTSPEGETLLKLSYTKNLSDFKVGDYLLLHKEKEKTGMVCTLYTYNDDDSLTISIYQREFAKYNLDYWQEKELCLDKACVDLRGSVFEPFCNYLSSDKDYWEKHLVNNTLSPQIKDYEKCAEALEETTTEFLKVSLTVKQREAIINSMAAKDYYLIQGPPGTGKSYVLSLIILEELEYFKHKVVVIGPNHMAINNLLGQLVKLVQVAIHKTFKIGQSYNAPTIEVEYEGKMVGIQNIPYLNVNYILNYEGPILLGMTPHTLYTRRARGLECDTLIIDEAGQMTIPLALMGMIKAKKVILAGDHKQLPPIIISDKIPQELNCSIFQKLLRKDNYTMLDITFRMCKPICDFVSELFYEGKLSTNKEDEIRKLVCKDKLYSFTNPIVFCNVKDKGLQVSEGEAVEIIAIIKNYLTLGALAKEIGVLSPFRAQVAHIRRLAKKDKEISEDDYNALTIDTIDKMQGQERDIIIFSMVSGDLDYMKEMGDFLYNPYKLNVAFSRAKSKLIIVGNQSMLSKLDKTSYPHIKKMLEYKGMTIIKKD